MHDSLTASWNYLPVKLQLQVEFAPSSNREADRHVLLFKLSLQLRCLLEDVLDLDADSSVGLIPTVAHFITAASCIGGTIDLGGLFVQVLLPQVDDFILSDCELFGLVDSLGECCLH